MALKIENRRGGDSAVRDGVNFRIGKRAGVDGRTVGAKVAADEGDMALAAIDLAFVGDHAELAVAGLDARLASADDVALVAEAVLAVMPTGEKGFNVDNVGCVAGFFFPFFFSFRFLYNRLLID